MTIQSLLLQYEPKRENILKAIKEINKQFGFFDIEAAKKVARYFDMSVAAVYSAASFYDEINKKNKAVLHIQVCDGNNCLLKGADRIIEEIELLVGVKAGDANSRKVKFERMSCNGNCLAGPVVVINGTIFEKVTPGRIGEIVRGYLG